MLVDLEIGGEVLSQHVPGHVATSPQTVADVAQHPLAFRSIAFARQQMSPLNVQTAGVAEDAVTTMGSHVSQALKTNETQIALELKIKTHGA